MKTIKTNFKFLTLLFVLASLSVACDGEDGMDGVNGINGIDGAQGPAGPQGPAGENGNANVISQIVDPFPSWQEGSFLGQEANFVEISEPTLTEDILDNVTVMVFFKLFNDTWYPAPYTFTFDNGNSEIITFTYEQEKITIYAFQTTGVLNAGISQLRYVLIPSNPTNVSTSRETDLLGTMQQEGIDVNDYYQVMDYLSLEN